MNEQAITLEQQLFNKVGSRLGFVYPNELIPDTTPTRLFLGNPQNYYSMADIRLAIENDEVLVGRQKENGEYELLSYNKG